MTWRAGALLMAALDVVGQGFIDERLKLAALALGERAHLLQDIGIHLGGEVLVGHAMFLSLSTFNDFHHIS